VRRYYYSADPEAAKADTFNHARAVEMSPSLNSHQRKSMVNMQIPD
jgi:hypothetical protein